MQNTYFKNNNKKDQQSKKSSYRPRFYDSTETEEQKLKRGLPIFYIDYIIKQNGNAVNVDVCDKINKFLQEIIDNEIRTKATITGIIDCVSKNILHEYIGTIPQKYISAVSASSETKQYNFINNVIWANLSNQRCVVRDIDSKLDAITKLSRLRPSWIFKYNKEGESLYKCCDVACKYGNITEEECKILKNHICKLQQDYTNIRAMAVSYCNNLTTTNYKNKNHQLLFALDIGPQFVYDTIVKQLIQMKRIQVDKYLFQDVRNSIMKYIKAANTPIPQEVLDEYKDVNYKFNDDKYYYLDKLAHGIIQTIEDKLQNERYNDIQTRLMHAALGELYGRSKPQEEIDERIHHMIFSGIRYEHLLFCGHVKSFQKIIVDECIKRQLTKDSQYKFFIIEYCQAFDHKIDLQEEQKKEEEKKKQESEEYEEDIERPSEIIQQDADKDFVDLLIDKPEWLTDKTIYQFEKVNSDNYDEVVSVVTLPFCCLTKQDDIEKYFQEIESIRQQNLFNAMKKCFEDWKEQIFEFACDNQNANVISRIYLE